MVDELAERIIAGMEAEDPDVINGLVTEIMKLEHWWVIPVDREGNHGKGEVGDPDLDLLPMIEQNEEGNLNVMFYTSEEMARASLDSDDGEEKFIEKASPKVVVDGIRTWEFMGINNFLFNGAFFMALPELKERFYHEVRPNDYPELWRRATEDDSEEAAASFLDGLFEEPRWYILVDEEETPISINTDGEDGVAVSLHFDTAMGLAKDLSEGDELDPNLHMAWMDSLSAMRFLFTKSQKCVIEKMFIMEGDFIVMFPLQVMVDEANKRMETE